MKYTVWVKINITMDQLECRESNRLEQVRFFGFRCLRQVSRNSMGKVKGETIRIVLLIGSGAGLRADVRATDCHGFPIFN